MKEEFAVSTQNLCPFLASRDVRWHICAEGYIYILLLLFFCILSLSDFLSQTTSFYFSPNEFPSTKFPLCPLAVTCPCFVFLKYTHFSTLLLTHTRTHTVQTFRSVAFFFRLMVCSVVPGQALVFSRGQLSSKRKVCLVTCYQLEHFLVRCFQAWPRLYLLEFRFSYFLILYMVFIALLEDLQILSSASPVLSCFPISVLIQFLLNLRIPCSSFFPSFHLSIFFSIFHVSHFDLPNNPPFFFFLWL